MKICRLFGIGQKKIIFEKNCVNGVVTAVKTCWWLKVNTKAIRRHSLDGAVFPHIISFHYYIDGIEYHGNRYINWNVRCPDVNEPISVFYIKGDPSSYAVVV